MPWPVGRTAPARCLAVFLSAWALVNARICSQANRAHARPLPLCRTSDRSATTAIFDRTRGRAPAPGDDCAVIENPRQTAARAFDKIRLVANLSSGIRVNARGRRLLRVSPSNSRHGRMVGSEDRTALRRISAPRRKPWSKASEGPQATDARPASCSLAPSWAGPDRLPQLHSRSCGCPRLLAKRPARMTENPEARPGYRIGTFPLFAGIST